MKAAISRLCVRFVPRRMTSRVCRSFATEEDDDVREMAVKDERILITEDKDFGQLVYAE
jgi:predicted nuclease of predicted toxin-antitoxin system